MDSGASRRAYIATCAGGLAGTAGCLLFTGDDRQGEPTLTSTPGDDEATADGTPTPDSSPVLGPVWVTDSVLHVVDVDGVSVTGSPDGSQYVFAAYTEDNEVDPDLFRLVVDDDVYRHEPPAGTDYGAVVPSDDYVGAAQPVVAFSVPVRDDVEVATVEYGNSALERWLSTDTKRRLTFDPKFKVREFSVPGSVAADEPVEAELTVANVGSGPGTFRASVPDGVMHATIVERALDAGEEMEFTEEIDLRGASAGSNYSLPLSWADGQRTETVRVEPTPTEGG